MIEEHSDERVTFLQLHLGGDRNFCYLIGDPVTGKAAAVDPGFAPDELKAIAEEHGLEITHILVTHGHSDHIGGVDQLAQATGADVYAGTADVATGARVVTDGDQIGVGDLIVEAVGTPGHAPDHVCYLCAGRLVTGDLLFCGKVGGTGPFFPGSSPEQQWESLAKILRLPDETVVFPGHDYYGGEGSMRHSSIGHERAHNPFLTGDFNAFIDLKENWEAYKKEHGIR